VPSFRNRLRAVQRLAFLITLAVSLGACASKQPADMVVLKFPGSAVGAEAEVLTRQLARFERLHPDVRVVVQPTPDSADERHQLYVQWLNAGAHDPDVLQVDVIWTPEFAAAGWLLPITAPIDEPADFFPATLEAHRLAGKLYAVPWFADIGILYYRSDLVARPPQTLNELAELARRVPPDRASHGFVWQGARYEGLVAVFSEVLGAFGGSILDGAGNVVVDSPEALRALEFLKKSIGDFSPAQVLAFREEQSRYAFQNGAAVFMRNWPYAWPLLQDSEQSKVAGRVAIAPMPAMPGGRPTAALGGAALAVNAHTEHPDKALELIEFLTASEQMLERAEHLGQLPPRSALYDDPRLGRALGRPAGPLRQILEAARPRPVTPYWTELSQILQIHLHRALTAQEPEARALQAAAREMRVVLTEGGPRPSSATHWLVRAALLGFVLAVALSVVRARRLLRSSPAHESPDRRLAWTLMAPALAVVTAFALFPLAYTAYESVHAHDLRTPWRGRPFVGLENYAVLLESARFWGALGRTLLFVTITVALELALGLVIALGLDRSFRSRGLVRATALLPWAIPTVVTALVWRLVFEAHPGAETGRGLTDPIGAWLALVFADVWKTTPFVALLLLSGLSTIDPRLDEAARIDGAGFLQRLWNVTLPLLKPALLVALVFRTLDAFRVFDLVYVLTGGGPGTATEPIALFTFSVLVQNLRFGLGSALSVLIFVVCFALALAYIRLLSPRREAA
jgi:multiple sugar transport system substrate-binding protein